MTAHDWNHNGEVDFQDEMIQYQVYTDMEEDDTNHIARMSYSCNKGCGLTSVQIYLLTFAFGVVAAFFKALAGA